jgi:hypothetical protein
MSGTAVVRMVESSCSIRKAMATIMGTMIGNLPEAGFAAPGGTAWLNGDGGKILGFLVAVVRFRILSGRLAR